MNSKMVVWIVALSALAIAGVFGTYAYFHQGWAVEPNPESWGQFGDYFGGILNPIFSFAAFAGLLYTIILQSRELHTAREANERQAEDLKLAREAAERQATELRLAQETRDSALQLQQEQTQLMGLQHQSLSRQRKLDDLDKAIRLQADVADEILLGSGGKDVDGIYRDVLRQFRVHEMVGSGDFPLLNNRTDAKWLLNHASVLHEILGRLGRLLSTYDILNTPHESPNDAHQWYYTNTWRFKYDSVVDDICALSEKHSELEDVDQEFKELFDAIDP